MNFGIMITFLLIVISIINARPNLTEQQLFVSGQEQINFAEDHKPN